MAEKPKKELGGPRNMSKGTKIIIGIFAVIMALAMMLPSLTAIFSSGSSSEQAEEQADSQEADDAEAQSEGEEADSKSDGEEETTVVSAEDGIPALPDNESLQSLSDQYQGQVNKFKKRLEDDPNNLAALLNLGQTYMNWGYSAIYSSSTDEETAYSKALVNKAIEYYNRYLELEDSESVKIQIALCNYYLGNTDEAMAALTAITEEDPDYALGWANLGMLYEQQYDYDNALSAYQKAVETDPNDEYGAKSYAEERIASINASRSDFSDLTNEDLLGTNSKPEAGLQSFTAQDSRI